MSLNIMVGMLADLKIHDPEGFAYYQDQFSRINRVLLANGLPQHDEPAELTDAGPRDFDMGGYSRLHYLRRLAAYLWAGEDEPAPGEETTLDDATVQRYRDWLERYYAAAGADTTRLASRFDHLTWHSDTEGYYLPVVFKNVLIPDSYLNIVGEQIGSSQALMEECQRLADFLELPLDLDPDSEPVWAAASSGQGVGDTRWERYGIESFTCLRLYHAARTSLDLGAAIVFN
jgi:hypothetical protein